MTDPTTIMTAAGGAAAGGGLSLWLTKLMVRRTMSQYDQGLKEIASLNTKMAVQEALTCEIVKPLRAEVAELRERLAKAEAALAKGWDADKELHKKFNTMYKNIILRMQVLEEKK
jgi:hypothetical protein